MAGVLEGIRILEIGGIGPAPFAGMMLADHGAEVITIDRPGPGSRVGTDADILSRSRHIYSCDLKTPDGVAQVRALATEADGLIEGFRPGVMERLGLGPDVLLADNPALVYGRMTGWGQTGPLAAKAGHDIDYIALSGTLHGIGRAGEPPVVPMNLIGDFGGGGMMLAFGILAGILHARRTGRGQVIDCAIVDGTAALSAMVWSMQARGIWRDTRGVNLLDGGAPFYDTYATADGKFVALGAIEPQFFQGLLDALGLEQHPAFAEQHDQTSWSAQRAVLARLFATATREDWCERLAGYDICFAPVLSMTEAAVHPHNAERSVFVEHNGVTQPAPAPRFSHTPSAGPRPARRIPEPRWASAPNPETMI
ncbi:CaiB/BaiF CoA transferase family protein [Sphingomonas sp.]|uniref:CaiB/BaiF CoA transferase family protein n=1 Tax=Sphingomonas sp. TaxID=28214 RepID=UPI002DD69BEE|nr:CaiB/BaiF CoA-transferase family protein [Sphingomonas sp.]